MRGNAEGPGLQIACRGNRRNGHRTSQYTPYDVIVIDENFAGSSLRSNALLSYLADAAHGATAPLLRLPDRRSFKTLDAMQAFAQSVHVVVNPSDLPNLAAILRKSTAEFDLLYKVYKDAVAAHTGR